MASRTDLVARLPSGRTVAYNEYGDPEGRPLFLLHALFFARSFGEPVHAAATERGVRVISFDRPGIGKSEFYPWTFEDLPHEIAALADHLGIDRFTVVGVSQGGPHALACALGIPERLTTVGLVSSLAPPEPSVLGQLPLGNPLRSPLRRQPWLWRSQMGLQAFFMRQAPGLAVTMFERMLSPPDREILSKPGVREYFVQGMRESVRQGGRGWAHEARRVGSERWDAWLPGISLPVRLWQGSEDRITPSVMSEYLASTLPHADVHVLDGHGHLWGIEHMGEVLDALMPA